MREDDRKETKRARKKKEYTHATILKQHSLHQKGKVSIPFNSHSFKKLKKNKGVERRYKKFLSRHIFRYYFSDNTKLQKKTTKLQVKPCSKCIKEGNSCKFDTVLSH